MLALLAASVGFGPAAKASILTFEGAAGSCSLTPGLQCDPNAQGYGVNFSRMSILNATPPVFSNPSGYDVAAVSPFNVLFRAACAINVVCDGQISMISNTFNFSSGYFTGTFRDGQMVTITGYRPGSLLPDFSSAFLVNTESPVLQTFNGWTGLEWLNIATSGGTVISGFSATSENQRNSVAMDNLDIELVPEPATITLIGMLLLSLFGFSVMRRRADA